MADLQEQDLVRWDVLGEDKHFFRSAMAKIWKELNKPGFSKKMGLTIDELEVFNDVVEQLASAPKEE